MKVIDGLSFASAAAAPIVISYVIRLYAASDIPTDETPRQKKHASKPDSCAPRGLRSPMSE
jgi:hypothetical protein